MCIGMCTDMCIDMRIDVRIGRCKDVHTCMSIDMCMSMCTDMCIGMCYRDVTSRTQLAVLGLE